MSRRQRIRRTRLAVLAAALTYAGVAYAGGFGFGAAQGTSASAAAVFPSLSDNGAGTVEVADPNLATAPSLAVFNADKSLVSYYGYQLQWDLDGDLAADQIMECDPADNGVWRFYADKDAVIRLWAVGGFVDALELTGSAAAADLNAVGTVLTLSVDGTEEARVDASGVLVPDDNKVRFGTGDDAFLQGELTALTDGSATTVLSVTMGNDTFAGLTIAYTIESSDGTEFQAEHGQVLVALVDDAGGVVADVNEAAATAQALSSGTLSSTWSAVTTDDGSIEIQLNADTSLTATTFQCRWVVTSASGAARTLTVP